MASEPTRGKDFLRTIVDEDLAAGRHQHVATRFPPEPNGYLHIGHAKAICVDFGIAADYGGTCNLRYDDTNPTKEDVEYVEAIERDVRWLGFAPSRVLYASDYFEEMYRLACRLIEKGLAYVDDHDDEQIKAHRGSLTEPGRPSPGRDRGVAENLERFAAMRAGALPDGACVLRAKIDLGAANMKMRDPLLYRIRHAHHHRTGDAWCIYPMYDYAHPLSDAFEGISHSICTLEFENNRELYDWVIAATEVTPLPDLVAGRPVGAPPRQYEFARLALDYTMMSKRKLLRLVEDGLVAGWDDPRMPTLAGMRRRGFTPEAIRAFCDLIGVAKNNSTVDVGKLEYAVRDDLNRRAPRLLGVLRPLKVTLTNHAAGDERLAPLFPEDLDPERTRGARAVPFDRDLYIDAEDFALEPPPGFRRLAPGRVVRLRYAEAIRCDEVRLDDAGQPVELLCSVVPAAEAHGEKVWGVLHWVSATRGVRCEVRLYDRLFDVPRPDAAEDVRTVLNPRSLEVVAGAVVEPHVAALPAGTRFQLERLGYFVADAVDARPGALVLNRVITLRDSWEKATAAAGPDAEVAAAPAARSARSKTRPDKKSAAEQRAIARARDPELAARHDRWLALDVGADLVDLLTGDRDTSDLFAAALAVAPARARTLARWIVNELPRELGDRAPGETALTATALAALVGLVDDGDITAAAGKELLAELVEQGGDPVALVAARGLRQVSSADDLGPLVDDVLARNGDKVGQYRGGKTGLLGFFVGQVMKASGGKANPATVNDLVKQALER
ncbi:MAG: glutamine--tRNA ligase/YqeY domain fusion protein [Kofleriaceae bacterium]|nr:glutamine--tRNA ligase/YqeY domain fusion protein [Kofleriaceae bacterium]MCL4227768.1 glutamine--tRNA ligase/YqeY domain fusion protein [Myxococcales bacterium]